MTDRVAVLWLGAPTAPAAPPGCDGAALAAAMAEDVLAVFAELDGIDDAIAYRDPAGAELARAIAWPRTILIEAGTPGDVLLRATELGYRQAAVVASDAPDLPALHLAKAFSALDSAATAVAPAVEGGVVILASRLPPAAEDAPGDALDLDRPPRAGLRRTLPWHRLRRPADIARLDPGLEGWEATRALLQTGSSPGDGR